MLLFRKAQHLTLVNLTSMNQLLITAHIRNCITLALWIDEDVCKRRVIHQSTAALFDAGGLMAVAPAIRETVSGVGAGHLDSSPDAHAVGTELDQIRRRSKRLGRAIGVQGADLMEANPWTGPAYGGIFRVLAQPCHLRQRQIVHGTAFLGWGQRRSSDEENFDG